MAEKGGLYYTDRMSTTDNKILYKCKLKRKCKVKAEGKELVASHIYFYLGEGELPTEMVINCVNNPREDEVTSYLSDRKMELSELRPVNASGSADEVIYCFEYNKILTNLRTAKEYQIRYNGLWRIEGHLKCMNSAYKAWKNPIDKSNKTQEHVGSWWINLEAIADLNCKGDSIATSFQKPFQSVQKSVMENVTANTSNTLVISEALDYICFKTSFSGSWWGNRKRVRHLAMDVMETLIKDNKFYKALLEYVKNSQSPPQE